MLSARRLGLGLVTGLAAAAGAAEYLRQRPLAVPVVAASEKKTVSAVCILRPDGNSGVSGVVEFEQKPGEYTHVVARVEGLSDGLHGFHIHEFGDLRQGCVSAGGHFNPRGLDHGGPLDATRHVGDLGNVASRDGVAVYEAYDPLVQLIGEDSVLGRSVVVHKDNDDLGRGGARQLEDDGACWCAHGVRDDRTRQE